MDMKRLVGNTRRAAACVAAFAGGCVAGRIDPVRRLVWVAVAAVALGVWGAPPQLAAAQAQSVVVDEPEPATAESQADAEQQGGRQSEGQGGVLSAALHRVGLDLLWERGHVMASVETDLSLTPRGRLGLAFGVHGFLSGKEPFSSEVKKVSWRQGFDLGRTVFEAEVGKSTRRLGRGRIDSLLLAGELPGFPLIRYSLEGARFRYDKLVGDLGTASQPYKRLIVHRVIYDLLPNLSVGAGEVSVRSAPHAGDIFYDVVPGLPLYLAKYFPGVPSSTDNMLVYLDAEVDLGETIGYGELIVNEFPGGLGLSKNPALYGILVGIERGPWLAEYSMLTNYVYSNGEKGAVYSHDGRSLGHWMGGDGDSLEIRWNRELMPGWQITVGGFQWRKGEGKINSWFDSLDEQKEKAFLSGVVQTTRGVVAGLVGHLGDAGHGGDMILTGELRAGVVDNENHKAGVTGVNVTMRAGVSFSF